MVQRWANIKEFLTACNPSTQMKYVGNELSAFADTKATLNDISLAYGKGCAKAWVIPQLYDLCEFCGASTKMTDAQMQEVATIISLEYHYLKVSELLVFFRLVKCGKYGKFYGAVDPMIIMGALNQYVKEDRGKFIAKVEKIKEEQKREEEKKIPHYYRHEWEELHKNDKANGQNGGEADGNAQA